MQLLIIMDGEHNHDYTIFGLDTHETIQTGSSKMDMYTSHYPKL